MENHLNLRFKQCLDHLKSRKLIPSVRQLSKSIDVHPQCISDIMTGKREVNLSILNKVVDKYEVNLEFLFHGEGPIMLSEVQSEDTSQDPILTVVTDTEGNERILYVPISAQAGYVDQVHDPEYIAELQHFNLPDDRFRHGTHRCFDVEGDSMEPCLFSGDMVVCSFVEPETWSSLRDDHVYVVSSDSGLVVKRITNNIKKDGTLVLRSANNFYRPQVMPVSEINEMWKINYKISPFMGSPSNHRNGLNEEMDSLKTTIIHQSAVIESLNSTIEKLLKQNRRNANMVIGNSHV